VSEIYQFTTNAFAFITSPCMEWLWYFLAYIYAVLIGHWLIAPISGTLSDLAKTSVLIREEKKKSSEEEPDLPKRRLSASISTWFMPDGHISASIYKPNKPITKETLTRDSERYDWQVGTLGMVERALYLAALHMQRMEFIALWITLKTLVQAPRWKEDAVYPGRAIYGNFLIGNGLSILCAVVAAVATYWAVGPSWDRNIGLAVTVPSLVAFVYLLLRAFIAVESKKKDAELKVLEAYNRRKSS